MSNVSLTRANIFDELNDIEKRISQLSCQIDQQLVQQAAIHVKLLSFRSQKLQLLVDKLFKKYHLLITCGFSLFIFAVLQLVVMSNLTQHQLTIICYVFLVISVLFMAFLCTILVEQILALIQRVARLKDMLHLYLSTSMMYAMIYTLFELAKPGSFNGVDLLSYSGNFKIIKLYLDLLYFSNVCQASVGFGDISPHFGVGRIVVFTQTLVSMGFLSILFSNWIS